MVLWTDTINNADMVGALNDLVHLNYDVMAACEVAREKVSGEELATLFDELNTMHERHIEMLAEQVRVLGGAPVDGTDWRQWATRGRAGLAAVGGDAQVISAMQTNEDKLYQAYKKAIQECRGSDEVVRVINDVLDEGQDLRGSLNAAADDGRG